MHMSTVCMSQMQRRKQLLRAFQCGQWVTINCCHTAKHLPVLPQTLVFQAFDVAQMTFKIWQNVTTVMRWCSGDRRAATTYQKTAHHRVGRLWTILTVHRGVWCRIFPVHQWLSSFPWLKASLVNIAVWTMLSLTSQQLTSLHASIHDCGK